MRTKGSVSSMGSFVTKINKQTIINRMGEKNNKKSEVVKKEEVKRENIKNNSAKFQHMFMKQKIGTTHAALKEAKKDRISSTNFQGRWMGFLHKQSGKKRGGCGSCYR